jgi:hypothetical protein
MTREQLLKWWLKPHEYIKYKRAMRERMQLHYTNYIEKLDACLSKILDDGCDYRHEFYRSIDNFTWRDSKEGHDYWSSISDRRRPLGTQTK